MTDLLWGDRPLALATDADRYFDYCLQPYDPPRSPTGKLRSENLLWNSFNAASAPRDFEEVIQSVERAVGRDMTVFGVKHQAGRLWWELYFYDLLKEGSAASASAIIESIAPWYAVSPCPPDTIPYLMVSFDLSNETAVSRAIDGVNVYVPYHNVQGGRSYKFTTAHSAEFENVYRFYHPKREITEIVHEIKQSVFVDYTRVSLSSVLLPELFTCNRICVAKKRRADAIYYSGIDVDQLRFFLRRFEYPNSIVQFIDTHRAQLDHLRFDVGFDYTMRPDGTVLVAKSSYYGIF